MISKGKSMLRISLSRKFLTRKKERIAFMKEDFPVSDAPVKIKKSLQCNVISEKVCQFLIRILVSFILHVLQNHGTMLTYLSTSTTTNTNRSEEHTSELQSRQYLVCRLLLEKKKTSTHYLTFLAYSTLHS